VSEELDRMWNDDANWTGFMYRCADDPRVVVRGHGSTLFTYNFAHPLAAWGMMLASLALCLASIFVPIQLGVTGRMYGTVAPILAIVAVLGLHAFIFARND
jgi:uncharacterized membrane protein